MRRSFRMLTALALAAALFPAPAGAAPATSAAAPDALAVTALAGTDISSATTVAVDSSVSATVSPAGQRTHVWKLPLTAGEEVVVRVRPLASGDATVALLAPGLTSLAGSRNYTLYRKVVPQYYGDECAWGYTPTKTGSFYVWITVRNGTFAYTLDVERTAADRIVSADANDIPGVRVGVGRHLGVVDTLTDFSDVYAVRLFKGGRATFKLEPLRRMEGSFAWFNVLASWSSSVARLRYGWATSANGTPLRAMISNSPYAGASLTSATFTYAPPASGIYYLWVHGGYFLPDDPDFNPAHNFPYALTISGNATIPPAPTTFAMLSYSASMRVNGQGVTIRGRMNPATRSTALLERAAASTGPWTKGASVTPAASTPATYTIIARPVRDTWYRWRFAGNDSFAPSSTKAVKVSVPASITAPASVATARRGALFGVKGLVTWHTQGSNCVTVKAYRYVSGKWVLTKTAAASATNAQAGYSTYYVRTSLPYAGRWKLVAYHKDGDHSVAVYSGPRYLTVK